MARKKGWILVSKEGLAELKEGRSKLFVPAELVKNSWDERSTLVTVDLTMEGRTATLVVEDDSPDGWRSLESAFTMFRPSYKKDDPTKRGRYEVGDKLSFAVCREVLIETMNGTVHLLPGDLRIERPRRKRSCGTKITCTLTLTKAEYEEICQGVKSFLPPANIKTMFNGKAIEHRKPFATFQEKLPTVKGVNLTRTIRVTKVEVHHPREGERPGIYEMGVRVIDTDDKYIVNVNQKVPLNIEQDRLPESYQKAIRVAVANYVTEDLSADDMSTEWVQQAAGDERAAPEFYKQWKDYTVGEKAVAHDPTNPDSNDAAFGAGYNVVPSRGLTPGQRANAKKLGLLPSSGQLFPTESEHKVPGELIPESEWSEGMRIVARYTNEVAKLLLGITHRKVQMIRCEGVVTIAQYCDSGSNRPFVRYNTSHGSLPDFDAVV